MSYKTAADYRSEDKILDLKDDVIRITDGRKFLVSTVHLGIFAWSETGATAYESMVFAYAADGSEVQHWTDYYCDRHSTEEAAREAHARIVGELTAGILELTDEAENDAFHAREDAAAAAAAAEREQKERPRG